MCGNGRGAFPLDRRRYAFERCENSAAGAGGLWIIPVIELPKDSTTGAGRVLIRETVRLRKGSENSAIGERRHGRAQPGGRRSIPGVVRLWRRRSIICS